MVTFPTYASPSKKIMRDIFVALFYYFPLSLLLCRLYIPIPDYRRLSWYTGKWSDNTEHDERYAAMLEVHLTWLKCVGDVE